MRKIAPHPLECSSPVDLAYNIFCRLLFLLCRPIDRAGASTRARGKTTWLYRRVSTVLKPENQLPITPLGKASTPRVRPTVYNRSYGVVNSAFGDFKKIGPVDPLSHCSIRARAIPISNLATLLNDEGIRSTTILSGNVIVERGSRIGDVSKLKARVCPSLSSTAYFTSTVAGHSTKEPQAEKALAIQESANTFQDID
ncbi:hypothetical protein ALC62_13244 [Cyphomyrmex costatus]|uniref:Uncharacterized protein n=1 Tax=Cyphomyrmex costatus TaxID=456900 RepID=A0A195C5S1_9HYME|nr:hypothetical protein ALC62_13244 [Cyphomyrmex costatus]